MRLIRGSEIWEIHHEGLIVRDGGAARRFVSADRALTAYVKAIENRRELGFVEMPDVQTDLEARLVMADDLQERGDPLGELIAIQHAMTSSDPAQHVKLERRMQRILDLHHDTLYGGLAAFVRRANRKTPDPAALEVTWRGGFAEEVRLQRAAGIQLDQAYAILRTLPLARQIQTLVIGDPGDGAYGPSYLQLVNTMVATGIPPHLRTLVLGAATAATRSRIHAGDLRQLIAAASELEVLDVGAGSGVLGPFTAPRLTRLAIAGLDPAPILTSTIPHLVDLDIRGSPAGAMLAGLPRTPLLAGLERLTIVRSGLGDIDLNNVLLFAKHYEHLEDLDLRDNHFSRALVAIAEEELPRIKLGGR